MTVSFGGPSGSGIGNVMSPDSGPFSPDGEGFDIRIFGDDLDVDTLEGLIDALEPFFDEGESDE